MTMGSGNNPRLVVGRDAHAAELSSAEGEANVAPISVVESRTRIASVPPPGNENSPTCHGDPYGRITAIRCGAWIPGAALSCGKVRRVSWSPPRIRG
ncbi:MAG TPA: hypothetical protein VGO40_16775, partial [Longimicrobium sp.]|nr:hypothetical protein [Longimicrobium sp.]